MLHSQAYFDGYNGYYERDENPYDRMMECDEYMDWARGWSNAQRDYLSDYQVAS